MKFVALDVETANSDMSSICQIGIAVYQDGLLIDEWSSLINPEIHFDGINVHVHGINESDVKDSPSFSDVIKELTKYLDNSICVSHTHFDRVSINKAFDLNNIPLLNITWLDSARVTRRTWNELSHSGYGLANVCKIIGYEFKHHDALEDAKASGAVMLAAIEESGISLEEWLTRVKHGIADSITYRNDIKKDGNPNGDLYGELLVFTGTLTMTRREAATMADNIGCAVSNSVTKKTTILVCGDGQALNMRKLWC